MNSLFVHLDAWLISLLLAALMLSAWRIGLWRGRVLRASGGEAASAKFDEAAMGLVALLLAFTFAMALGKHDHRRQMVISDSNAIGDFYTLASLLRDPVRSQLHSVIRDYTELRLAASRSPVSALQDTLAKFDGMQQRMTELVAEAVTGGTPIAAVLANALNSVTSSQASRLAAVQDRLPAAIVWLLFLAAAISTALIGRQQGFAGRHEYAGLASYVLLVTLVVYVTLELNQPGRGLIRISQEPFERLLASMGK